ncbi:MAG: leucyl aminopeptidase [Candidatus Goldiibacteriota bacterium]
MKISTYKGKDIFSGEYDCRVFFVFEDENVFSGQDGIVSELSELFKAGKMPGGYKEKRIFTFGSGKKNKMAVAAGLGRKKDLTEEKIRNAAGVLIKEVLAASGQKIAVFNIFEKKQEIEAMADGIMLAAYEYRMFHTEKKKPVLSAAFFNAGAPESRIIKERNIICTNVNRARELQNMPANIATPSYIEKQAKEAAKKSKKITVTSFGSAEIKKMKMGAFYAVARGAKEPAKLVVMNYKGGAAGKKPMVFIGKGITFDTGGISLKSQSSAVGGIEDMKFDMSGAAVVYAFVRAAAEMGLKENIIGLLPLTENVPDAAAYKPGDVLKSLSGKTIEVISTDAEGRLVLCDTITYAKKFNPEFIADAATLTGACVMTFGNFATAVMGNNEKLIREIISAGEASGERCWQLPLWEEYGELIKSKFADMKNVGGIKGGTITAGMFLKEFAGDTPWVHLDIAGSAYGVSGKTYIPDTGSGIGVRLLMEFLRRRTGKIRERNKK